MLNDTRSTDTAEPAPAPAPAPGPAPHELDPRATRQVDDLEAYINRQVSDVGHRWESIADRCFDTLLDGDVAAALAGRKLATAKYDELSSRAGKTLAIGQSELSRAVRIGALNHRLRNTDWTTLPWSIKAELLPLLGAEPNFDRLQAGIAVARKQGITVRELREWVSEQRIKGEAARKKEPKLTPLKASKVFEFTAGLRLRDSRRDLADKVRALDDENRAMFLSALAEALRNLAKLQQEFSNDDE